MKLESKNVRILVVDDHPMILKLTSSILEDAGFEVLTADRGRQALDIVNAAVPDVMLLDISMPGMSGMDVLAELRSSNSLPVVIFSFNAHHREHALAAGADDFIVKPFEPDNLVETIERVSVYPVAS